MDLTEESEEADVDPSVKRSPAAPSQPRLGAFWVCASKDKKINKLLANMLTDDLLPISAPLNTPGSES